MRHSSDEDTDLSESELENYIDDVYRRLKRQRYVVKISSNTFKCPFCPAKRKQEYDYHGLLQHAKGPGRSSRGKLKEKGDHKALSEYLEKYHSPRVSIKEPEKSSSKVDKYHSPRVSKKEPEKNISEASYDRNDKFVWPWKGIVANLPRQKQGGRWVGESGSKYRDELTKKGFNPLKVEPLWNHEGHSGFAAVHFNQDGAGLINAMAFEKSYEVDQRGRRAWFTTRSPGTEIYGWVAREADFNLGGVIGKHLRVKGHLKSMEEFDSEQERKKNCLVSNLIEMGKSKDSKAEEMQSKLQETCALLNKVIIEKDTMTQAYNEEMEKIQKKTMEDTRKIFGAHEEFKLKIESQKEQLERREKELKNREANYEKEIVELRRLRKMNENAAVEQIKADANVLRLVEEQKREKEELHKKIMDLQTEIDSRQALELEIERLRGAAQVMEHMGSDVDTKKKMEEINNDLKEKEDELEDLEALTQTLIVKEKKCNDELQDARKELIAGLSKEPKSVRATIGVKYMGALDEKLFGKVAKEMYPSDPVPTKAEELMEICRSHIEDHDWHPFKRITEQGILKEVINEDDERLQSLRNDLGDEGWQAMVTVMMELNEYNPSGRYSVPEIWHMKEGRKATLKEGMEYIINKWKTQKKTRKY